MNNDISGLRENQNPEPNLILTKQGATVLYKDRYLYSKYNPEEPIKKAVNTVEIPPQCIVICASPLLGYGLKKLLEKLPEDSFLLLLEGDINLYQLSVEYITALNLKNDNSSYLFLETGKEILSWLETKGKDFILKFRRVLRLDFSGGVFFSGGKYNSAQSILTEAVNLAWKNKMTLIRFGKLFTKNIFLNLSLLHKSEKFPCITKPVFALGAGESIEQTTAFLKKRRDEFFIAAVDAALIPLLDSNICPDCVIVLESQIYNNESFIGIKKRILDKKFEIPFFICDLTSRFSINRQFTDKIGFILSDFADLNYLKKIKEFKIPVIPPLGSVGLALLEIITFLNTESYPVFFSGLDFSYKPGKTHGKGTHQIINEINKSYRLLPPGTGRIDFSSQIFYVTGINGEKLLCDPAMNLYGKLMNRMFKDFNFFDFRTRGIPLDFQQIPEDKIEFYLENRKTILNPGNPTTPEKVEIEKITDFLESELTYLQNLCRELSGEEHNNDFIYSRDLNSHEYLFIHFPDNETKKSKDISFYKRLKMEALYFSKIIRASLLFLKKSF